jgi:hypothetical protein
MRELQQNFVLGFLGPYLSYVRMPLLTAQRDEQQREDVPPELVIQPLPESLRRASETRRNVGDENDARRSADNPVTDS